MLKTVSSIINAIGALNYKGTWNASTNTPTLASGVGTKGDYYVVSTAGTTTLDGISNWGVGDWATFNGSVWQRVEGGADLNGVNLSVSGTSTLSALTASTALALNGSKEVVSVTNTGTGNNVLATSPTIATPTLTGDVQMSTGSLVVTSGNGVNFANGVKLRAVGANAIGVANSTPTTLFTLSGTANAGRYDVQAVMYTGAASLYTAFATVMFDGLSARISANNGSQLSLSLSGLDVQATQTSGAPTNIQWTYMLQGIGF